MDQLLDQVAGVGEIQRVGRAGEIPAALDRHAPRGFQAQKGSSRHLNSLQSHALPSACHEFLVVAHDEAQPVDVLLPHFRIPHQAGSKGKSVRALALEPLFGSQQAQTLVGRMGVEIAHVGLHRPARAVENRNFVGCSRLSPHGDQPATGFEAPLAEQVEPLPGEA